MGNKYMHFHHCSLCSYEWKGLPIHSYIRTGHSFLAPIIPSMYMYSASNPCMLAYSVHVCAYIQYIHNTYNTISGADQPCSSYWRCVCVWSRAGGRGGPRQCCTAACTQTARPWSPRGLCKGLSLRGRGQ